MKKVKISTVAVLLGAFILLAPGSFSQVLGADQSVAPRVNDAQYSTEHRFKMPLTFEDVGNSSGEVKVFGRGPGYELLLTPSEAVFVYPEILNPEKPTNSSDILSRPAKRDEIPARVVSMRWLDANPDPRMTVQDKLEGFRNYYVGNEPQKWRTRVPLYRQARYEGIYPGIDLVYYENGRRLEYDFVAAPGSDPSKIRIGFRGIDSLSVDENGCLVLHAGQSRVVKHAPVVYQEIDGVRVTIPGRYTVLAENEIGFAINSYDRTKPLVIDPTLDFLTYLGGGVSAGGLSAGGEEFARGGLDRAHAVALDGSGNVYVLGETYSDWDSYDAMYDPAALKFPVTGWLVWRSGGYTQTMFMAKFSPTGELLASIIIDGKQSDIPSGIAVDEAGNTSR